MISKNWHILATIGTSLLAVVHVHEFFAVEKNIVGVCELKLQEGDKFESILEEEEDDNYNMW